MEKVGEENIDKLTSLLEQFNNAAEEKIKAILDPECLTESCDN